MHNVGLFQKNLTEKLLKIEVLTVFTIQILINR